jgi:hypothetical protein
MSRLPTPGADNGQWGDILNDFLSIEHNSDGTLKASGTIASKADNSSVVHLSGSETITGTKIFSVSPTVPTPTGASHATRKDYVDGLLSSLKSLPDLIEPSGDISGATDSSAINSALSAGNVTLRGTYYVSSTILIPSNRLFLLWDAEVILTAGSARNILRNTDQNATGNSNIHVYGIGKAILNGQASSQSSASAINTIGVSWVHVTDLSMSNITIGPCYGPCMVSQGVVKGRYYNIELAQDLSTSNQDGIDFGPACSDIIVDGVYGKTGDDCISIFAQKTAGFGHSIYKAASANASISNITIRNVTVDVGINPVRLQAGDTYTSGGTFPNTLSGVHIANFVNLNNNTASNGYSMIVFGEVEYVTTPPAKEDLRDITFNGYRGRASVIVGATTNFMDVHISNVTITSPWKTFMGVPQYSTATSHTIDNVTFSNIKTTDSSTDATGSVLNSRTGSAWSRITVDGADIRRCGNILNNGGSMDPMVVKNINVTTFSGQVIRSTNTELGALENIYLRSPTATNLYLTTSTRLRLNNVPAFKSGDVVPDATTAGSMIHAEAGFDPTNTGHTTGGVYLSSGSVWFRISDFTNQTPVDIQFPSSVADPSDVRSSDTATIGAGSARYYRVRSGGTISKIGLQITTQAGNIDVGIYRNNGQSGQLAAPGSLVASSGSVACPAVGYAEVSLSTNAVVMPGDWIALATDNASTAFRSRISSAQTTDLAKGRCVGQSVFPLPTPLATPGTAEAGRIIVLNGVV